jgi:hypothetical protein
MCLLTYRLVSLFQMMCSLGSVSAAYIYASIYVFGIFFTYELASLFQMLFSFRSYRHTEHLKALRASTLCLSKTLSVTVTSDL